ncbi:anti-sigma factor antagonist [Actinomadura sp. GC306]|uniref:STAS domain-containing protein n=1 Tax=Actinomadura sp. GC306 TaxID=2530367 RepID=UPI0010495EC1|nr:STAS domain-containing protein [Actinomadura sp. GC306]TDC70509.1 anti-sigma factor antagonist [Actinomadura sp. GC306]
MTDGFRPSRRTAGRRAPEVRCRTAAPPGAAAPAAPSAEILGEQEAGPDEFGLDGAGLDVATVRVSGETAVVLVTGEIDLRTADLLRARLVELHAAGPRRLVADFSAVPFCDAAGLGALVAAHNQIAATGGEIVLAGVRPAQLRLLRVTGLQRLFAVHPDVRGALAALDSPTASG